VTASATVSTQEDLDGFLAAGVSELGISLDPEARRKLIGHLELLDKWNRVYNLTAVRDKARAVSVHILDSLAVLPYVTGNRVLDVGSGAGFPGLPIALARPDLEVDLLDANHKKCAFLAQAIADTGAPNAKVVCSRVESYRPASGYDCIISRAFAETAEFVALSGQLLAPGGSILAMKGVHPIEEIARIPSGYRVRHVRALSVPGLAAQRHVVLIERA
jgi:16S rRNA (guanine527-N7)-methyltransferase